MPSLAGAEIQAPLADATGRAGCYLAGLDQRWVAPDDAALAGLARFDAPLPEVAGGSGRNTRLRTLGPLAGAGCVRV